MKVEDIERANKLLEKLEQTEDVLEAIGSPEAFETIRVDIEAVCRKGQARRLAISLDDKEFACYICKALMEIKERAYLEIKEI